MAMDDNDQIIIYQSEDGETRIEVKFPEILRLCKTNFISRLTAILRLR